MHQITVVLQAETRAELMVQFGVLREIVGDGRSGVHFAQHSDGQHYGVIEYKQDASKEEYAAMLTRLTRDEQIAHDGWRKCMEAGVILTAANPDTKDLLSVGVNGDNKEVPYALMHYNGAEVDRMMYAASFDDAWMAWEQTAQMIFLPDVAP